MQGKRNPVALLGAAAAALALVGCSAYPHVGNGLQSALTPVPPTVVARVGGETITLEALDRSVEGQLKELERQRAEQEYTIRQTGLDEMINTMLLRAEARRRGASEDALLKTEVDDKTPAVTEAEVKSFYEAHAQQMPGPFEQIRDRLRKYLQDQNRDQRLREYEASLRTAARVEVTLPRPEPPRVDVAAIGPARGPANAPVTIVMFSDFQCPFCAQANPTIERVLRTYGDKVRLVFRDFPLSIHEHAEKAAEAARCAGEQGKFWQMHDMLFGHQDRLAIADLKADARQIGLDGPKFDACLDSGRMAPRVKEDLQAGERAGVDGTPAFFINGQILSGAQPFEEFKRVIDGELARLRG